MNHFPDKDGFCIHCGVHVALAEPNKCIVHNNRKFVVVVQRYSDCRLNIFGPFDTIEETSAFIKKYYPKDDAIYTEGRAEILIPPEREKVISVK